MTPPMDRRIATLIALLAREYRGTVVKALAAVDELGEEEFSEEELAGLSPGDAAQVRDLKALKKGIVCTLELVDDGVSALDEMSKS